MTIDKELPALRDLRRRIEDELADKLQVVNQQVAQGNLAVLGDLSIFGQDIAQRRAELRELDYVIRHFEQQGLLAISPAMAATLATIMLSSMLLLALVVYALAGVR
jgi:hypothetical protein